MKKYYSQLDPKWKNVIIPNSNATIGNVGCLITCMSNIFQKRPDLFVKKNKELFLSDGSMLTEQVVVKMGSKLTRIDTVGGMNPPTTISIGRTSFYTYMGYPTHFYVRLSNGDIIDPASMTPYKTVNKYLPTTNQWRTFAKSKSIKLK